MSGPSRFSSLNSFFRSKTPNPPPPPPKDRDRDNQSLYAQSSFSLSTRSFTIPRSTSPAPTTQTANSSVYHLNGNAGASSSVLNLNQFGGGSGSRQAGQSSAPSSFKRGVSRIASGLKRPKSRANLLQQEPATPKNEGDDGSISTPWNFQHNIHVDESFNGLPPSWSQTLLQAGYSDAEIAALYDARRARTATPASTLRSASPAPSQSSLVPRARSSSLSRKRTDTADSSSGQPIPPLPSLMGGPPSHSRQESESSYAIVDPDESVSVQSDSQYVHLAHARNGQAVHAGVITPFPMPAQPSPTSNPNLRVNGQGPHGSPSINGSYVGVNVSYGTANGTRATYSPSLHSTASHTTNSSPRIPQARSDSRPQTPQRRTPFRVVNATEGLGSPPPAYGNGRLGGENNEEEELPGLTSADLARERPSEKQSASGSGSGGTLPLRTGTLNGHGVGLPPNGIARRVESPEDMSRADTSRDDSMEEEDDEDDTMQTRISTERHRPPRLAAPRLSLRPGALDLDDLGSWSSALLSSLPSASDEGPSAPPPSAINASASASSSSHTFSFASSSTSSSAPARRSKRFSRPVLPAIVLQDATAALTSPSRTDEEDEEEDEGEGDITLGHSPLYNELLGMMGSSSSLSPSPTPSPSTSTFPLSTSQHQQSRAKPPGAFKPPNPHLQLELSRHDSRSSSFAPKPRDSVASSVDVNVDDYAFPVPPGSATSVGSGWPSPSEDTFAFRRQNRDTVTGLGVGGRMGAAGPSVRVEAEEDEEEWDRRDREGKRDTLRPGASGRRESTGTSLGNRASVATVTDSNRLTLTIDERRRSGRDSNASASTVTHATIVRGASVVRRVHASPVHLTPSESLTEEEYLSSAPASPLDEPISPGSPAGLAYRHRTQNGMLAPPLSQADEEDEEWEEGDAEAEAEWARRRAAAEAEEEELSAETPAPRRRPESPDSNSEEGEGSGSGGTGSTGTTASAEDHDSPPKVPPKSPSTANLSIGSARPSIAVATDVLSERPEREGVFSPSAGSGPASAAPSFSSLAPSPSHTISPLSQTLSPQTQPLRPPFRAMDTDLSSYTDVSYATMATETDASGETRVSIDSEVSDTQRVPLSAISGGFLSPTIPNSQLPTPQPQAPRNPGLTVSTAPSSFVLPAPHSASSLAPPGSTGSVPPSPTPSLSRKRSSARASGLSRALKPLAGFLDASSDPRAKFTDLSEIAQGESGSVFSAKLVGSVTEWRIPATPNSPLARDKENEWGKEGRMVALKIVPAAGNAVKLSSLKRELELVRGVRHPNILGFDGVFVDTDAEALWLAMELMERSLADVLSLSSPDMGLDPTERGKVILSERLRARCVWDALLALSYLKKQRIAHRDLRSDNLLVSPEGVIKLADFGCAVRAPPGAPRSSERVGVVYWQAPEMRTGLYDPLKIDVWSLGATAWELAAGEPPFSDGGAPPSNYSLPPLPSDAEASRAFEDFLHLCAQPPSSRAEPDELLNAHFVRMAAPRSALVALLGRCKVVEDRLLGRSDEA